MRSTSLLEHPVRRSTALSAASDAKVVDLAAREGVSISTTIASLVDAALESLELPSRVRYGQTRSGAATITVNRTITLDDIKALAAEDE